MEAAAKVLGVLKLRLLRWRAAAIRDDILLGADRREEHLAASVQINHWIVRQQVKLRQLNARIASLESPERLLDEALASRSTR